MPTLLSCGAGNLRAPLWRHRFRPRLPTFQAAASPQRYGGGVFPLFLGRRRAVLDFARGDIEHALCPLVQVAGPLRVFFGHDGIMCAGAGKFQSGHALPYSNWPTTRWIHQLRGTPRRDILYIAINCSVKSAYIMVVIRVNYDGDKYIESQNDNAGARSRCFAPESVEIGGRLHSPRHL